MSARIVPSPTRRRVRTGCLTCRSRRRKCDEGKPTCANCRSKSLRCHYGSRITFATPWTPSQNPNASAQSDTVVERQSGSDDGRMTADPVSSTEGYDSALDTVHGPPVDHVAHPAGLLDRIGSSQEYSTPQPHPVSQHRPLSADLQEGQPHASFSEIQLLSCYRDKIATMMDLGIGDAEWGVRIMRRSTESASIHDAVLAVSRCYACRTLNRAGLPSPPPALAPTSPEDETSVNILRALEIVLSTNPRMWLAEIQQRQLHMIHHPVDDQQRQIWYRIVLAAIFVAPKEKLACGLTMLQSTPSSLNPCGQSSTPHQLKDALQLLGKSLHFFHDGRSRASSSIPLTSAWLSCWSEAQIWYAMRGVDFQPLLDLTEVEAATLLSSEDACLPCLMFSNAAAMVANTAHHLTALVLLQHRPRLVRATAELGSSISVPWHALRIAGIAETAVEHRIWDPLLASALVKAGERLSHVVQLAAISRTLKSMCILSGMQYEDEIRVLEDAANTDFSAAF